MRSARRADAFLSSLSALAETGFGEVNVTAIELIKSVLLPGGPEYSVLHRTPLMA